MDGRVTPPKWVTSPKKRGHFRTVTFKLLKKE